MGVGSHTITVTATDAAGNSATCTTIFTVQGATVAAASGPTDMMLYPGLSASFSTLALGTGPFSYEWRKDGAAISGATAATYRIDSVSAADSGAYCVVIGGACTRITNCATLTVNDCMPATAGTPQFNPQTSLFEQKVRVTNPTTFTLSAVNISISGLRQGVQVFNTSGDVDGVPFVKYNEELGAGETTAELTIEYYVIDRQSFEAQLCARPVLKSSPIQQDGTPVKIDRAIWLADGTFMIEFSAVPGQVYHIQYGDDMLTWKTVTLGGTSSANRVQWIDNGQPKTESFPSKQSSRFYRVITAQ